MNVVPSVIPFITSFIAFCLALNRNKCQMGQSKQTASCCRWALGAGGNEDTIVLISFSPAHKPVGNSATAFLSWCWFCYIAYGLLCMFIFDSVVLCLCLPLSSPPPTLSPSCGSPDCPHSSSPVFKPPLWCQTSFVKVFPSCLVEFGLHRCGLLLLDSSTWFCLLIWICLPVWT